MEHRSPRQSYAVDPLPHWQHTKRASAALLAALCATQLASADTVQYQATAIDPSSGHLLYRETHLLERDNGRSVLRVVLYQCADGTVFARKRVDYADSLTAPEFELVDARANLREGMRRVHGHPYVFFKPDAMAAERGNTLASGGALVVDAGFDEFVTRNWAALAAGKTLAMDFAVPSKGDTYTFKLSLLRQTNLDGVPALVFRMNLGGLLSLFAPHIDVTYGLASHNLLRFEGVTDIHDGSGRQVVAQIDFPATAPTPAAADALQNALAVPLKACRIAP